MANALLTDKDEFPTEEIIFSHIGNTRTHWDTVFNHIRENHPEFASEWRYYKDGQSWLMKTTRKSKTIYWLSVVKGCFNITFYFGDKAEPNIMDSNIPKSIKESFKSGKRFGKIRAITIPMKNKKDVEAVKLLIEIKLKVK